MGKRGLTSIIGGPLGGFLLLWLWTAASAAPPQAEGSQGKLYVTAWFRGVVSVVDVASREVSATVPAAYRTTTSFSARTRARHG